MELGTTRAERRRGSKDLDDVITRIDRVHFEDGDTVVVYAQARVTPEMIRTLGAALEVQKKKLHIILLPATVRIDALTEAQMAKLGYVRKKAHGGLILPGHLRGG